ncbi:hypothetical protein BGW80DRAFT_1376540 [Lactifluus volemus]|nr:hypothetical protein BGW80DRAFT_1376540 [Lactifluus volemus]
MVRYQAAYAEDVRLALCSARQKTVSQSKPKPLHVVQPEGVSFKMDRHVLEWQKWKMHIGGLLVRVS